MRYGLYPVGVDFRRGPDVVAERTQESAVEPGGGDPGGSRRILPGHRDPLTAFTSSPIPVISMLILSPGTT